MRTPKIPKAAPYAQPTNNTSSQNGKKLRPLTVYYHKRHKEYIFERSAGNYQSHTLSRTRRLLLEMGYNAESLIEQAETKQCVDYTGPIGGHRIGRYIQNEKNILVTEGPNIIAGVEGDWPIICEIITNLISSIDEPHAVAQWNAFHGIMKFARKSLVSGIWRQKQALALAGPVNAGKSLLQEIITVVMGGRCARTAMYVQGGTTFNSDLIGAEHLMMSDENASTKYADRMRMGAAIKRITADKWQDCHSKRQDKLTLSPFWLLTISLNDNPERLMILPPLIDDISDKIQS